VSPTRLLDTRAGAALEGASALRLGFQGQGPLPATGMTAVAMNVTVTDATETAYLTVWPDDQPMPEASNLNWVAGRTVNNLVLAPTPRLPATTAFVTPFGRAHLVVDVVGYFHSRIG
jgi:hypothetical protein